MLSPSAYNTPHSIFIDAKGPVNVIPDNVIPNNLTLAKPPAFKDPSSQTTPTLADTSFW